MAAEEHQFKIEDLDLHKAEEHNSGHISEQHDYQSTQKQSESLFTPIEGTPTPSDHSPQPQSQETSSRPQRKRKAREWYDGYKPSKKQKKSPRPGEVTFRVPMSMEQRKSLGASVRPKESVGLGISNKLPVDPEIISPSDQSENPIVPATRGGTKLKFRAYGLPPLSTIVRRSNTIQSSQDEINGVEQQTNQYYQYPSLNDQSHGIEDGPKLAWWLAQQISQASSPQSYGHMSSQVLEIPAQQFYGNEHSSRTKKRQTDRERKARWREANGQKSKFAKACRDIDSN